MRTVRDAVCLLVALASVAVAAWQPAVATDALDATPAGAARHVDDREPLMIDRAILTAPLVKA